MVDEVYQTIIFDYKSTGVKEVEKDMKIISDVVAQQNSYSIESQTSSVKLNKATNKQEHSIRTKLVPTQQKLNGEMKRFKMEALGIMFGGMAIEKAFSKMTKAGFDLYQISDILNTTYAVMMLPVMDILGEAIFGIADYLMGLGEEERMVIGTTMILGQALGTVLAGLGQAILFVSSLQSIGGLAGLFKELTGIFTKLGSMTGKALTFGIEIASGAKDLVIKGVTKIVATAQALLTGDMTINAVVDGTVGGLKNALQGFVDSKIGRGLMVVGGTYLIINSIIQLNSIETLEGFNDEKLLQVIQTAIGGGVGAGLITYGITQNGKKAIIVAAAVTLMEIQSKMPKNDMFDELAALLAPIGIGAAALGYPWLLPVVITLAGMGMAPDIYESNRERQKTSGKNFLDIIEDFIFNDPNSIMNNVLRSIGIQRNYNSYGNLIPPTANGGITTRPQTRLVGEAGPEAIIPLNKLNDFSIGQEVFAPEININASISSDYDVAELAEEINRHLHINYKRRNMAWA